MRDVLEQYDAWRAEGHEVGRAVVLRTYGSAPRQEGSVLLVADDGRMVGSVSGGCVEGAAAEAVAEARRTGVAKVVRYGISDDLAWSVGLQCGGTLDVLVEPTVPDAVVAAARGAAPGAGDGIGTTVVTDLPADTPAPASQRPGDAPAADATLEDLRRATLAAGRSRTVELPDRTVFIEAFPATPRLVIVGATEVARSLVGLAKTLGYERIVIDARSAFATPERFPDVDRLIVDWPEEAFDAINLGPNDAVAVLSHDDKFDEPAVQDAMRRGARYVGAIGSKKTQAARRAHLLEAGMTEEQLSHLHGPIGLDLGGREPAETALAILAEIVAARRGGSAAPMIDRAGAR
ncbi:MAG TPA: XdhC/CoxI family protein [Candidatus Limnocylindrales bacterium]|nr:XdhC/CoxI family protein [Candidatus Limnocylindrales bacterium]